MLKQKHSEYTPKLFSLLQEGISKKQLLHDINSGVIVAVLAFPMAIAFAIASGVSPEKGLITAVVAGLIVSALGGSRVQIAGPTGAFIVIIYSIVQVHGVQGLSIATLMAGIIITGLGLLKFGQYLKFVSYPLIIGFTSGIAVIILSSQINDFLGLNIDKLPADFIQKWEYYFLHLNQTDWQSLLISLTTILIIQFTKRYAVMIPASLLAIILLTGLSYLLHLSVPTIGSKYGDISNISIGFQFPEINFFQIQQLMQPALAIALLGSIESLLSAVVSDGMIGGKHRSNMELIAQGIANIFSSLVGGIPATGAIVRTAANVKNGGRTPISGITHALILFLIMLLFLPIVKHIPMACLSGILVVVAYHMGEWHHFYNLLKSNKLDVIVLLCTFLLTVFFDLIVAIEIGLILSSFVFLKRMSESTSIHEMMKSIRNANDNGEILFEEELAEIPESVLLYEINGPLFFGATEKFQEVIREMNQEPKILILRMRNVPFIDASGMNVLREISLQLQHKGTIVMISGANNEIKSELLKSNMYEVLGLHNIHDNIRSTLTYAQKIIKTF